MKRLAELCDNIADQCEPSTSGATVYVGLEHINCGAFRLLRHGKPSEVHSSKNRFRRGDILYGKLRPYLDKAVLADYDGICSTDVLVFRPKPDVCGAYLLGLIHSANFLTQAISTTHGVNHPRTSWPALADSVWDIPPKPEQEQIAAVLWRMQRAIEVEQKLIATARELKHSAMRQLFTCGLHGEPQKDTDIGPVPKSWSLDALGAVTKLERGRFLHRPRNEPKFYGGSTPFIQTGDVVRSHGWIRTYTQTLNEEGVAISRVFPKGTILITIAANIGYTGVLDFDSACPDSLVGIVPSESLDTWYLEYFLQTQQAEMDRLAPKGTQKNINIQFLDPWPVAFPPLSEQRQIANALQAIDRIITVHEQKQSTLQELFKTLLHQLMTGQMRVNNLDIDVSEVQS